MSRRHFITDIFLQPGEFYFGGEETRIRTTLGSCVAITLWHPPRRLGGMCHYMLPSRGARAEPPEGRYADEAMELLMAELARAGTRVGDYEVKLFGGGNMFPDVPQTSRAEAGVPARNVRMARELVGRHGLRVKAESLGGVGYRQLIFEVWSGDVWVRHVPAGRQTIEETG